VNSIAGIQWQRFSGSCVVSAVQVGFTTCPTKATGRICQIGRSHKIQNFLSTTLPKRSWCHRLRQFHYSSSLDAGRKMDHCLAHHIPEKLRGKSFHDFAARRYHFTHVCLITF
jgi:hypothetical protein